MAERLRDGERNVTGVWNGLYSYPDGRSTSFVATLIEAGGSLTGTTHEPSTLGGNPPATLFASLVGSRSDAAVHFIKTYDRPDPYHASPIVYEGALNSDGTEIEGRWTIVTVWSGKFLMIRSPAKEVKAAKRAFART